MKTAIQELLENLKLPEYRTRYRVRRELRGRKVEEVLPNQIQNRDLYWSVLDKIVPTAVEIVDHLPLLKIHHCLTCP